MNKLPRYNKITYLIIAILCLLFLLLGYGAIEWGIDWFAFVPIIVLVLMLMVLHFDYTMFAVALLTPFSIFTKYELFSVAIPTEPILILTTIIFLFELSMKQKLPTIFYKHSISKWIILSLLWIAISMLFSTDFVVSLKHLIARLWFIIPCYFMMLLLFKDSKKILGFVACYGLALSIIIVISTVKYALKGFDHAYANYIMTPFYNDHTAYGAAIGMFFPISFYFLFAKKTLYDNVWLRVLFGFVCACLLTGFILCYARATWLSLFVAFGVLALVKLKVSKKFIVTASIVGVILFALTWSVIKDRMSQNSQDSSGNIVEHIQSISNISTDASNTERINRWACALSMAKERPIFGFGFGTYQFEYGKFQKSKDLTIISTNEGTVGSVHSEYLGPLCETGIFGLITILMIFGYTIYTGIRAYYKIKDKNKANLILFLTISLITYYIHGIMNNFLETDKLAIPFWAMTAMIVALDTYSEKENITTNNIKHIKK